MSMLFADFSEHLWAWIGGGVGLVLLILVLMSLPDIMRYIRIKNM
jgi:hypothetical protein